MSRAFPQGLKPIDGVGFMSELKLRPPEKATPGKAGSFSWGREVWPDETEFSHRL